ncbi:hypothetical protein BC829DRAFT_447048 [Chytridium lagenaria]|nr:hypothetical protein BC829DRAFT_447048 [Chytridium lagenaria]
MGRTQACVSVPCDLPSSGSLAEALRVCPYRAAAGSVEKSISLLRSAFSDPSLVSRPPGVNPIDDPLVARKDLLVAPVQALPVFSDKVALAVAFWRRKAQVVAGARLSFPPFARLSLLQNVAFVLLMSSVTRRGGDLARLHPLAFHWLPNFTSVHIALFSGKTITGGIVDRLILSRNLVSPSLCAIAALAAYASEADMLATPVVSWSCLFPFIHDSTGVTGDIRSARLFQAAFKAALVASRCFANDTLQGMRVAGAISASVDAVGLAEVMRVGAWRSAATAARYSSLAAVLSSSTGVTLPQLRVWRDELGDFLFFSNWAVRPSQ